MKVDMNSLSGERLCLNVKCKSADGASQGGLEWEWEHDDEELAHGFKSGQRWQDNWYFHFLH